MQVYYSKNVSAIEDYKPVPRQAVEPYSTDLKLLTYSVNNNTIFLRATNLDDSFDGQKPVKHFDIIKFATFYYN